MDAEGCADQLVDIIDFRTSEKIHAHRVDQHGCPVALDGKVIIAPLGFKVELIGEAGTAAADDRYAQELLVLAFQDLKDLAGGCL